MTGSNPVSRCLATSLLILCALLTGCATRSTLDSEVLSFTSAPSAIKAGPFSFERLPSQYQEPSQTMALEQMAQTALEKQGFTRNDASPQYSVQIGAWTSQAVPAYPDPFYGRLGWPSFGRLHRWHGHGFYRAPWPEPTVYLSRVRLEIRDLATGKVVYESTASNEQSWFDANRMFPAMFEAALAGFPAPPGGIRKVTIQLPPAP